MKSNCNLVTLLIAVLLSVASATVTAKTTNNHKPRHHQQQLQPVKQTTKMSIDLNTATVAELATLKHIGAKKAAAIVAYRQQHGAFKSLAELIQVSGISQNILDANQGHLKIAK